jgi:hypothetical protein
MWVMEAIVELLNDVRDLIDVGERIARKTSD